MPCHEGTVCRGVAVLVYPNSEDALTPAFALEVQLSYRSQRRGTEDHGKIDTEGMVCPEMTDEK